MAMTSLTQYPGLSPVARPGFHQAPFDEWLHQSRFTEAALMRRRSIWLEDWFSG